MNSTLLQKFFLNTATQNEVDEVIDWVEASEENKQIFLQESALHNMLLLNGDDLQQTKKLPKSKLVALSNWKKWVAAASLLLVAITSIWIYYVNKNTTHSYSFKTIVVPVGKHYKVKLADGSVVTLNSKSVFKYPTAFNDDSRIVVLDGEGYFDIAHDKKHPFIVQTATHNIKVLGTVFNIKSYKESGFFETTLISGSVKVEDKAKPDFVLLLKPNEKYLYNKTEQSLKVNTVNAIEYTNWKEGFFNFNDQPLSEVINAITHQKNIGITVTDSSLLEYRCTGKFKQTESVEDILDVIKTDLHITYQYNKATQQIIIQPGLK